MWVKSKKETYAIVRNVNHKYESGWFWHHVVFAVLLRCDELVRPQTQLK